MKIAVFDAYGTLFDVYSIAQAAEAEFPGQGQALAVHWRDKQIQYSQLITLADPQPQGSRHYQSFWEVTRAALQWSCARLGLSLSSAAEERIMGAYATLSAFDDAHLVLQGLKQRGVPTAILSNGSPDMLHQAVTHAGLGPLLDAVISVDGIAQFKVSPRTYALVQQHFEVEPHEVLFVSSNGWDALGATWYGFTTYWVNRMNWPAETLKPLPHYTGKDLLSVLNLPGWPRQEA